MPIPLREVLADPSLQAAEPSVLAGEAGLGRLVRWVHTSEVLEIADLLRGGELLLIGGVSLATASVAERHEYIRGLARRRVAGLAIETGRRLPTVPQEMVDDAAELGLPLIELRQVVPFVSVTEAINGQLVNVSVRRLQHADRVSHALAAALASDTDLDELIEILARETDADVELISLSGEPLALSSPPVELASTGTVTAPVTTGGVTVATLLLHPRPTSDALILDAARDRAPEALGLALLRSRPLSHLERDAQEFLTLARTGIRAPQRFTQLADRLGLSAHPPYVGVIARLGDYQLRMSGIDEALRRGGRMVISYLHAESYLAVVALSGRPLRAGRAEVVADLHSSPLASGVRVAVGPGCRALTGLGRSLDEAETCFAIVRDGHRDDVVDALDVSTERLLVALDNPDPVSEFIDEQLGELLALDTRKGGGMIDTLSTYLLHWGSKTDTAKALHLHRQSLYQRLDRIFNVLGEIPQGSPRLASLMIAVELETARRRSGPT